MLEYTLKPGEKDIPHTHPAKTAYVVSGGKIKVYMENGETEIFDEKTGTADWSDGAGKHCKNEKMSLISNYIRCIKLFC